MSNDAYKEKLATPPSPEKVKEMVAKTPMSGPLGRYAGHAGISALVCR